MGASGGQSTSPDGATGGQSQPKGWWNPARFSRKRQNAQGDAEEAPRAHMEPMPPMTQPQMKSEEPPPEYGS